MTQGVVLCQWRTAPCTHKFLSRFLTLLAPRQPGPEGGLPCPCHRLFGHSVSDEAACCPARNGDLDDHASGRDLAFCKLKCAACLPPSNRGRFKQEAAVLISLVAPVVAPGTTGVALSGEGLGADIQ